MSENTQLETSLKPNGFKPKSYGDIVAIASLLAMLMSTVAWGLKLEGELNAVRADLNDLKVEVAKGILPRAEERIRTLEDRVKELHDDFDDHDNLHANGSK